MKKRFRDDQEEILKEIQKKQNVTNITIAPDVPFDETQLNTFHNTRSISVCFWQKPSEHLHFQTLSTPSNPTTISSPLGKRKHRSVSSSSKKMKDNDGKKVAAPKKGPRRHGGIKVQLEVSERCAERFLIQEGFGLVFHCSSDRSLFRCKTIISFFSG